MPNKLIVVLTLALTMLLAACASSKRRVSPSFRYPPSPIVVEVETPRIAGALRGRGVTIGYETPIEDVLVESMTGGWEERISAALTDRLGRFDLGPVQPGEYNLRFMKPGFDTLHLRVLVQPDSIGTVVVELNPSS